ncbi:MAG: DUF1127 domain-containing protein [Rhodobacteraceae bacterium]|nr:DUF1127 domain-containing protein [Paracoccaceae bacterium]
MTSIVRTISAAIDGPLPSLRLTVKSWMTLARTRKSLAALTPEQCRDVGLSPDEAHIESTLPFWKA